MRKICALALLCVPVALAGKPVRTPMPRAACRDVRPTPAGSKDEVARFQRLGDLPPANETLALLRSENGCLQPVTVRYGIGGTPPATDDARR